MEEEKIFNVKKGIIAGVILAFIFIIIILFSLYMANEDVRHWIDIYILRKSVSTQDVSSIDLNIEKNNQIYCYGKNICILNDRSLNIYNNYGQKTDTLSIDVNTALFDSSNKYLAIAEKSGKKFDLILDKTLLWEREVEGEILQVHVNNNGYVAIVWGDTTYKSIISLYSPEGNELFKNYLSSTRVVDVSVSRDNKFLAFAEMDTSGTLIQSNIKIISVEKATKKAEEAIIYSKAEEINKMVVKIKYQEKNKLVCMYDDSLKIISDNNETEITKINQDITFASVDLKNSATYIKEETSGLFSSSSIVNIVNTGNNQVTTYSFPEVAKEIYTYDDVIAINIGTDIYFINTSGLLIKKYTSEQEVTNIILSNGIALIIYKDRVEIVEL